MTTVIALEAFIAMKLRSMDVSDGPQVIEYAVRALRDTRPLELLEHELRIARSLVLAGLARQEPAMIDAGLLRARSVLENDPAWSKNLELALHGLVAIADIVAITRDAATEELVTKLLSDHHLDPCEPIWMASQTIASLSRAGTVLEKLGRRDAAMDYFKTAAAKGDAKTLEFLDLKFRVELGVRLFGVPDLEEPVQNTQETEGPSDSAGELNVQPVRFDELPAENIQKGTTVSTVVLQNGSSESVVSTIEDILAQTELPDQIIVLWSSGSTRIVLPDIPVELAEIYGGTGLNDSVWQLAFHTSNSEWVWMIPSGVRILPDTLKTLKQSTGRKKAIYLSRKEGDLETSLQAVVAEPSLSPERCLLNRAYLNDLQIPRQPKRFWDIVGAVTDREVWREVTESGEAGVQQNRMTPDDLLQAVAGLADHYKKYPVDGPEERKQRRDRFSQLRDSLYQSFRDEERPLVSVVLGDCASDAEAEKSFSALIRNTQEIPFEIIAVLPESTSKGLRTSMLDAGVLVISEAGSTTSSFNRAASKAKGHYLVILDGGVEVEDGWLQPMLSSLFEETDAAIAGGLVQSPAMTIQHAGIAFDDNGKPVYLHKGGPLVLSHIHKRRPYQAVAGGIQLVSTSLWNSLHGLDEGYDDALEVAFIDLCLRGREKGVRVVYEPKSKATRSMTLQAEVNPHFQRKWNGKIVPDLELYARMDGYRIEKSERGLRLVPIGPVLKGEKGEIGTSSSHASASHVIKAEATKTTHSENDLASLLTRAETLMRDGRFDVAEEALTQGQHQVNGNVSARVIYWTLLGDSKFRLNKTEDAYQCYRKAVKDDPSAERAWIGIATYHLVKGELDEAEDLFRRVVGLNDMSTRGHLGLGNVFLRRGQPSDALSNFVEASRLDPGYRPTIVGLVAAAVQAEKMGDAIDPLQQYLQIHPEDNEARFHYAAILYGSQDTVHAREEAMRVLEVKPDHQGARELLDNLSRNRNAS